MQNTRERTFACPDALKPRVIKLRVALIAAPHVPSGAATAATDLARFLDDAALPTGGPDCCCFAWQREFPQGVTLRPAHRIWETMSAVQGHSATRLAAREMASLRVAQSAGFVKALGRQRAISMLFGAQYALLVLGARMCRWRRRVPSRCSRRRCFPPQCVALGSAHRIRKAMSAVREHSATRLGGRGIPGLGVAQSAGFVKALGCQSTTSVFFGAQDALLVLGARMRGRSRRVHSR